MPAYTKTYQLIAGVIAAMSLPIAGFAADPPVTVTNTAANAVNTVVTNSAASPVNVAIPFGVNAVITNQATKPIPSVITNTASNPAGVVVTNVVTSPVPTLITNFLSRPIPSLITNTQVPVVDVNKPAHIPFSKRLDITFSNGSGNGTFTVPTGKRLVIKYVSADVGVAVGANALCDLATVDSGAEVESHPPLVAQGVLLGQQIFSMSEQTLIFADPGSTVTIAFLDSNTTSSGGSIFGVYGYLVDASATSFE